MDRHTTGGRPLSQFTETWIEQMAHGAGQAPACTGWFLWASIAGLTTLVVLVLQTGV